MVPKRSPRSPLMPSLTIKRLPEEIYASLKTAAEKNHRSLNSEIIVSLQRSLAGSRPPADEVIDSLRQWHKKLAGLPRLTAADIKRARREGRP